MGYVTYMYSDFSCCIFKLLRQIAFPVSLFVIVDCVLRRSRGVMATMTVEITVMKRIVVCTPQSGGRMCQIIQVNFLLICISFRS